MATLNAKVFKHHKKKTDGTYNVKIVLYHNERVFIDTEHFVVDKQLTKSLKIKDQFILAQLEIKISGYRKAISDLGDKLKYLSADSLREHLEGRNIKIDFLKFSDEYIAELKKKKETEKTAANFNTVRNHLIDFNNHKEKLPIEFVTVEFIGRFEKFLRSERLMMRKDNLGRVSKKKGEALGDASVHVYLRDFQGLFAAAMKKFNRPSIELVPIKHNPFDEYDIVSPPQPEERNLTIAQITKVRDCKAEPGSRVETARNMALLSFYLCGMNTKDFHNNTYKIKNDRIEYCRSKTTGRRKDRAFISIKIPEEALSLLEFAAIIPIRYASIGNFNKALSKGMAILSIITGIPELEFYKFRHGFADLASNNCKKPTREIALALNHVENGFKSTNIYISKHWEIVDEVQRAVLNLIRPKKVHHDEDGKAQQILFEINLPSLA